MHFRKIRSNFFIIYDLIAESVTTVSYMKTSSWSIYSLIYNEFICWTTWVGSWNGKSIYVSLLTKASRWTQLLSIAWWINRVLNRPRLLSCREKYCVEPELLDRPDLLCVVDRMQHVFHWWRLQAVSDWLVISLFSIYRVCLFLSSGFIVLNPNAQNNILLLEYTVCDLIFPSRVSSTLGHHAAP